MVKPSIINRRLMMARAAALAILLCTAAVSHAADKIIGIIMTGDIEYFQRIHKSFIDTAGGTKGIEFMVQVPSPEPMAWTNAARKLVVIESTMIIAYGAPATLTVMKETANIPILYAGVYDPKEMDIAGKNATGISSKIPMEDLLRRLKEIKDFKNLGIVFNKSEKDTILQVMEVKKLEASMGFTTTLYDARKQGFVADITGVDAILMTTSCAAMCSVGDVVALARKLKIPTAASITGGEDAGIILTMAASPDEQGRTMGEMALRLVNGHQLSTIPMRDPKDFVFIINAKEAAASGLTVPASVTDKATKVIK